MSNSWPSGVAETLWNYGRLLPQDQPQLPMMGVAGRPGVLVAFVIGCAFLAYFAWDRFNKHANPKTDDFRYQVMKKAEVADLGGSAALAAGVSDLPDHAAQSLRGDDLLRKAHRADA